MNAEAGVHAFFTAVHGGHVEEVASLLDADPQLLEAREDEEGDTPLVVAAEHGHAGVISLLLERGADVNASDIMGYTALQYTAEQGHEEVVSILLSRGADFSRQSLSGFTALMLASLHGHLGIVRQLLQHMAGRGLDERDGRGCTALRWACSSGHVEVARCLLLAGADHTIAGSDGLTPRQVAAANWRPACVPLLEVGDNCRGRLQGHAFEKRIERRCLFSFCVHSSFSDQQD
jgi:ankyrin repeat protein